ncbi:MAG: copper amine oxidase N-terminal domain-containing protein [Armatimonadetes bacterium]|nr:copper amine oxidase N-terminal domain-containing protein [Armatimonadota bacterium]
MQVRRMLSIPLAVMLAAALMAPAVLAQPAVRVLVDGQQVLFDQPPATVAGRVLVPLRGVFERMGATVAWDDRTQSVLAVRGTTTVQLQIGSRIARVNNRPIELDVPAMLVGGRTLVPLRFISESLGANVEWNADTRVVAIWTGGQAASAPTAPPPTAQPPAPQPAAQTVRGVLAGVNPGEQRIAVASSDVVYRIRITGETAITRVDTSGAGGSVSLSALRRGDDVEVAMSGNVATQIRARYQMTSGRIEAIAKGAHMIILSDGRTVRYVQNVMVTSSGQVAQAGVDALKPGQIVEMRLNPSTQLAWEIAMLSGAAQVTQAPAAPPAPPTVKGIIIAVTPAQRATDQPRITVEAGGVQHVIRITPDTAISRVEASSGAGGSVGVAALKAGDDAEVTMGQQVATRVRASYLMTNGRIEAIAKNARTVVLSDGRSIKYVPSVLVMASGQVSQQGADVLRPAQVVEMRLNPTTREAWEINILSGVTQVPREMRLTLAKPKPGESVGSPIEVQGTTAPNSRVEIGVTWFLGFSVGSQIVTADANGGFAAKVPITVVAPSSSYLVTVTAVHPELGRKQEQFTVTVR